MKKSLILVGMMVCSMTMLGQAKEDTKKEIWYFKLGGSYFTQTAATEFPVVGGQLPNKDVYTGGVGTNKLSSRESVTGSFGAGFRSGLTAGYRFNSRVGFEMGVNYYTSNSKTMAQTTNRLIAYNPTTTAATYLDFTATGTIKALDLAPSLVLFLGQSKDFEPYTKVGVILPVYGDLTIDTDRNYRTLVGANQVAETKAYSRDIVKPNPTLGFTAALGTSYKLGNKLSAFAEIEYRNFTVHGKTKETTVYTENGVDKLNTPTTFRADASYSAIHTNYVDRLDANSNNSEYNSATVSTRAKDELSSYVGISGLGLTLGLKYSL